MIKKVLLVLAMLNYFSGYAQKDLLFDENKIAEMERSGHEKLFNFEKTTVGNMYDLVYHRFNWNIDPAVNFISGGITSYYIASVNDLTELTFDMLDVLMVDSIIAGDETLTFDHSDDILTVYLNESLMQGALDSLTVWYHGVPSEGGGFGSFIQDYHNGHPIIWTLSEPYGAKDWWPCKQNLNDKVDSIDIYVTTPEPNRVASNGILISETLQGTDITYHWKHKHPIPAYLIAISVTNYEYYSEYILLDDGDSIEVLNYVYPENLTTAQGQTIQLLPVLEFFNEKFMMYPYKDEKYGHAQFGWGGGMEHQTMSFVGSFNLSLLTHELAHQWFGDYITCGSWEDIWLNEGFATYLTGMMYEEFFPDYWLDYKEGQIDYIISQPGGSVLCTDTTQVWRIFDGRLSYTKAGMVLHMLRHELGDEIFFTAVQNYLHDPELANGYALTAHLQSHFEEAGDTSLQEFFNDWYAGEGYPSYSIYWWQYEDGSARIAIEQDQSHTSVEFFEMHVPLYFVGEEADTAIVFHHLENNQEFEIEPGFRIENILVDPQFNIVKGRSIVMNSTFLDVNHSFSLYPNPVNGKLTIESNRYNSISEVIIYDVSGKVIDTISYPHETKKAEIVTTHIPGGVYFVKIVSGQQFAIKKMIFRQ